MNFKPILGFETDIFAKFLGFGTKIFVNLGSRVANLVQNCDFCWKGGLKEQSHAEKGVLGNCLESVKRGSYGPHVPIPLFKVSTPLPPGLPLY